MTKYEWEKELKRNIQSLPKSEVDTALDYYNELFEDKSERGMSEKEIIREFGNPFDVAVKILAEYQSENGKAKPADEPDKATIDQKKKGFNIYNTLENVGDKLNQVFSDVTKQIKDTLKSTFKADEKDETQEDIDNAEFDNANSDTFVYDSRDTHDAEKQQKKAKNPQKSSGMHPVKAVFVVPFIIFLIAAIPTTIAFVVSGAAMSVGGVLFCVSTFAASSAGVIESFMISMGTGIGCFGAGLILYYAGIFLTKWLFKGINSFFGKKDKEAIA